MLKTRLAVFTILLLFLFGCSSDDGDSGTSPSAPAELDLSVSSLDFDTDEENLSFFIHNEGGSPLAWELSVSENWLEATPTTGTTPAGDSTEVEVTVDRDGMSEGSYSGEIEVTADDLSESLDIDMEVAAPVLSVSVTELTFDKDTDQLTFEITNAGDGELTWSIANVDDMIEISPSSGTTMEETDLVTVSVDRSDVSPGFFDFTITVESNVGDHDIAAPVHVGEIIWAEDFENPGLFNTRWIVLDDYDDIIAGEDFWGLAADYAYEGSISAFCAENGNPNPGEYSNNMEAWMYLTTGIGLFGHEDVVIRFWMKYDIASDDNVRFLVENTDGYWYATPENTWTGGDFTWQQFEIALSDYGHPSSSFRFAFQFNSDFGDIRQGAYVDLVEVWAK